MDARQTYGDGRKARPVAWASVAAAVVLWSVLPGASGEAGAVPGTKFRDCPGCPEMVVVPEGRFEMGSMSGYGDKSPVREVTIARPFAVGVNEVTFGEWDACVSGGGCGGYLPDDEGWGRGRRPVVNVSWNDAQAYVRWLSGETGEAYRLLSESEWEYAARAGTTTAQYWGESESGQCRYANGTDEAFKRWRANWAWQIASCDDGHATTAPVGSYEANGFGLHDVLGNVWEWVEDCWNDDNDDYYGAPSDGSAWTSGYCHWRVLRGGSWIQKHISDLDAADRDRDTTGYRNFKLGFRVARTLTPKTLGGWQESKGLEGTGHLTREQLEGLVALEREAAERLRAEAEEVERLARRYPAGTTLRDCPGCPEMVVAPGGQLGRPFAVGVYEVTFGEWDACVSGGGCGGYRPSDGGWGRGRRPVIYVSWQDAQAYVRWLSWKTGEAYRLLSEVEWEYVARAGTATAYLWGNDVGRNRANCFGDRCGDSYVYTAPVGSFSANPFGLHDVHGNVWEWVEDCWEGDCGRRVLRGGSWDDVLGYFRSALRNGGATGNRFIHAGFRVARTLTP